MRAELLNMLSKYFFLLLIFISALSGYGAELLSKAGKRDFLRDMSHAAAPSGRQIRTMKLTYQGRIPAAGADMKITSFYQAPDRLRTETSVPGMPEKTEIFDGERGWSVIAGGSVRPKTESESRFLKLQALLNNPATMLNAIFRHVEIDAGFYDVNAVRCRRLLCSWPSETGLPPMEFFVGADDKLVHRTIAEIPSAMGSIRCITDFSGHREFDGVVMAVFQRSRMLGMEVEAELLACEFDIPLNPGLFTRPQQ